MMLNEATFKRLRPDLTKPTAEDAAEVLDREQPAAGAVGGTRRRRQRRGVPGIRRSPLHHRNAAGGRRRPDAEDDDERAAGGQGRADHRGGPRHRACAGGAVRAGGCRHHRARHLRSCRHRRRSARHRPISTKRRGWSAKPAVGSSPTWSTSEIPTPSRPRPIAVSSSSAVSTWCARPLGSRRARWRPISPRAPGRPCLTST